MKYVITLLSILVIVCFAQPAQAQLRLGDICRVKGQEENVLQGLGLVVGLKGTGDGDARPTSRALASIMAKMGSSVAEGPYNQDVLAELKHAKNVALVFVTARVPAAGARQGDRIDVQVSAISAKSLDGGSLLLTPLLGPRPNSNRVYALASGLLQLDDLSKPTTARIHQGCQLEADFYSVFTKENRVTLVLDKNHAGFQTAQEIADLLNSQAQFQAGSTADALMARAVDQVNIEVRIPEQYHDDPVLFVSQILSQRIINPQTEARVVINERAGTVVIGADVEIGPVAVTHKNITIETVPIPYGPFMPLDTKDAQTVKLKVLVEKLNALKLSPQDIIDIIKGLERTGKLYGRVIIE